MKMQGKHLFAQIGAFPRIEVTRCLEIMLQAVPVMGMNAVGSSYTKNPDQVYIVLVQATWPCTSLIKKIIGVPFLISLPVGREIQSKDTNI